MNAAKRELLRKTERELGLARGTLFVHEPCQRVYKRGERCTFCPAPGIAELACGECDHLEEWNELTQGPAPTRCPNCGKGSRYEVCRDGVYYDGNGKRVD